VRYWTVEEARAYLPRLRVLLGVIRRAAHLAVTSRGNGHAALPGASPPGASSQGASPPGASPPSVGARSAEGSGSQEGGDDASAPPPAEGAAKIDVDEAVAEIEAHGIVLRDVDRGLIDFPTRHPGGRDVLLCWQLGEDDLAWWHLPEDGFAGRRPLPLPPEI
jgi:hypothetical protein